MPLRALINDKEVISIHLSDEGWKDLKKKLKNKDSKIQLTCCGQSAFLRRSHRGLKHFVHVSSDKNCNYKPESKEHLRVKAEILEACKENGWDAFPEFAEEDWIADVLAVKGTNRISFEVQWSSQTYEETKRRQERYKESNVRGCWFFRTAPKEMRKYEDELKALNDIPSFKIFKNEDSELLAKINDVTLPIKELVASLLNRKIKFCKYITLKPKQEVNIIFFENTCWKCGKPQHCYTVEQSLLSKCNQDFYVMGSMWNEDDLDKHPNVYATVKSIIKNNQEHNLRVGELKQRYSKTVNDSYLSHGCFYCDAIFGDFFLNTEKAHGVHDSTAIGFKEMIELGHVKEEVVHWCYSETKEFCE